MPPDSKDMARLWDMLDAARAVVAFTIDLCYEDFVNDRKTRNAVERNLEIIGEAARNVSALTREWLNTVPWRSIIGLRNVLAHEYGEIRQEIIWAVIQDKITPLIQQLESAGADEPPSV